MTDLFGSPIDIRAYADFRRDELEATFACQGCGSREPARIEGRTCSDCASYPRCGLCGRWVGDGSGWLPGYVNALDGHGEDIKVCTFCWKDGD